MRDSTLVLTIITHRLHHPRLRHSRHSRSLLSPFRPLLQSRNHRHPTPSPLLQAHRRRRPLRPPHLPYPPLHRVPLRRRRRRHHPRGRPTRRTPPCPPCPSGGTKRAAKISACCGPHSNLRGPHSTGRDAASMAPSSEATTNSARTIGSKPRATCPSPTRGCACKPKSSRSTRGTAARRHACMSMEPWDGQGFRTTAFPTPPPTNAATPLTAAAGGQTNTCGRSTPSSRTRGTWSMSSSTAHSTRPPLTSPGAFVRCASPIMRPSAKTAAAS